MDTRGDFLAGVCVLRVSASARPIPAVDAGVARARAAWLCSSTTRGGGRKKNARGGLHHRRYRDLRSVKNISFLYFYRFYSTFPHFFFVVSIIVSIVSVSEA